MSYYREEETRRMLENEARWGGDRPSVKSSASLFDRIARELRRDGGLPIPVLAEEALQTKSALDLLRAEEVEALRNYHTTNLLFVVQMRKAGLSNKGLTLLLHRAHGAFWSAMDAIKVAANTRRSAYQASQASK